MREARHRRDRPEFLHAPPGKIAIRNIVLDLQARLEPLELGGAELQGVLVAVHHARHGGLLPGQNLLDGNRAFLRLAAERAEQVRFGMAHRPPVAGINLVPIPVDAGFTRAAVVKEDGDLPDFGPGHHILPLARLKPAVRDVVLDRFAGVGAFEIAHLAVDDRVFVPVHGLDAHDNNVGRFVADPAEGVKRLDIGGGGAEGTAAR